MTATQNNNKHKTRRTILDRLKERGAQTAPSLARHLGVTSMAVRLHLYDLADEGLISFTEQKQGRGRPAKFWQLTDAAQDIFPDAHQSLAVDLITSVKQAFGQKGLDTVVTAHSTSQLNNYTGQLSGKKTLASRVKGLAKIRTAEGYMASAQEDAQGWLFSENHCPICFAAKACTKLCANELWVFSEVLGPDVTIEREEHILSGARRCLYRIKPKAG